MTSKIDNYMWMGMKGPCDFCGSPTPTGMEVEVMGSLLDGNICCETNVGM